MTLNSGARSWWLRSGQPPPVQRRATSPPPLMPATIYLHWAATPYSWVRSGHYHTIISGDGRLNRLHAYSSDLPAHTWRRNSNSVALSCACMAGQPDPWTIPPTELQLDAMCREAATIARSWGWREADINIEQVMTHAEAASNRDGRWDFLQLSKGGPPTGGDELRARIRRFLAEPDATARLAFRRATSISARGQELAVELEDNGSSWALAADLLARSEIPYEWDAIRRRILIGSLAATRG